MRDKINTDSSVNIGSGNSFTGDTAIGANARVEKPVLQLDSTVCYKGERKNTSLEKILAPKLVEKFGIRNLGIVTAIELLAALATVFSTINTFAEGRLFDGILTLSKEYVRILFGTSIILIVIGAVLLGSYLFYFETRCNVATILLIKKYVIRM